MADKAGADDNLSESALESTKGSEKPDSQLQGKQVHNVHVRRLDDGRWEAEIEYQNDDGNSTTGETRTFDDFSRASAWVAGIEVDLKQEPLAQEDQA